MIFMHVKLAEDYSLLISSHKVGKIVHALEGGRTMDPELRAASTPSSSLFIAHPYCVKRVYVCCLCLLDFIITVVIKGK